MCNACKYTLNNYASMSTPKIVNVKNELASCLTHIHISIYVALIATPPAEDNEYINVF